MIFGTLLYDKQRPYHNKDNCNVKFPRFFFHFDIHDNFDNFLNYFLESLHFYGQVISIGSQVPFLKSFITMSDQFAPMFLSEDSEILHYSYSLTIFDNILYQVSETSIT